MHDKTREERIGQLYYTGVGSRQTPREVCEVFTHIAELLEADGFILRSGGADGADLAFEDGVKRGEMKQIFLPWNGFNGSKSPYTCPSLFAYEIARETHPAWEKLSMPSRRFHARNTHQVLGPTLDEPSTFVLCYTQKGKLTGGTSTAIRLAHKRGIPCFNAGLYFPDMERLKWELFAFLEKHADIHKRDHERYTALIKKMILDADGMGGNSDGEN